MAKAPESLDLSSPSLALFLGEDLFALEPGDDTIDDTYCATPT